MRAYNLSIGDVASSLRQENIQVPAGELSEGDVTYSLRTIGDFRNIEQIRNTIVANSDGNPVYVKDVADIEDGIAQPIGNVRVQGDDGVIINIYKQSDSNVVTAASGVMGGLDELREFLPPGVELSVLTNKADFIEMSIRNLILTGIQAISFGDADASSLFKKRAYVAYRSCLYSDFNCDNFQYYALGGCQPQYYIPVRADPCSWTGG